MQAPGSQWDAQISPVSTLFEKLAIVFCVSSESLEMC